MEGFVWLGWTTITLLWSSWIVGGHVKCLANICASHVLESRWCRIVEGLFGGPALCQPCSGTRVWQHHVIYLRLAVASWFLSGGGRIPGQDARVAPGHVAFLHEYD